MKYVRNVVIAVGVAIFLFGAGAVVNSFVNPVKTTGSWYLQVAGLLAGGTAISAAGYKFLGNKKEEDVVMTEIKKEDVKKATVVNTKDNETKDPMIHLDMTQLADYECLNHLTVRFASVGDTEAVEHCKKLQERMFELYYGKTKESVTT